MGSNWYVIQVTTGKELFIKDRIEECSAKLIQLKIFQKELIHFRKGKKVKIVKPLFSSYIFVYKNINEVCEIAKQYLSTEFINPIKMDNKPCQVYNEEMELLLHTADESGTFRISQGLKLSDKVEIVNGPLKTFKGNILWFNEKKSKAKVEISLFNRKMTTNLGLELIAAI